MMVLKPAKAPGALSSIKTKMTVAVSLLVALLVSLMAYLLFEFFEGRLRESISQQQFTMVSAMVDQIDDKISAAQTELLFVAQAIPRSVIANPSAAQLFLEGRLDTRAIFDNGIFLLAPDGRLLAGTRIDRGIRGGNFARRSYFQQTLATKKPYISDPFLSQQEHHHPVVVFTAPVFNQQREVVAVLTGSLDLMENNFLGRLASIRLGKAGYLYLYSKDRTIIVHHDRNRILRRDVPIGVNGLFDAAIDGFEGTGETITSRGLHAVSSFKHLRTVPWILAANFPYDEAFHPLIIARRYFILALLCMVSFSIVFIWLFMRHLTRPLLAFTSHVQRIGRGAEHTLEPIIISRRDEVGTLAEAFNAMLGEIAKQRTAVQDQLHFLQLLIDSMPTPIFYKDYEGRYLGCNRAFSDVLGFRREELIGKTVFDIAPTDLAQIYQRADLELLNHGGTQVYEASLAAPDGSRHEVVYYKATFQRSPGVMGGLVGTIIDITARKQAEAALAEEKEFSERLLQNAALPCFVIDHQHRVMSWNAACEKLTGLKSEDMVGSTDQWRAFYDSPRPLLADLVLDGLPERVKEYYQISGDSILTPGGMQAEGWLRLSNAQERYLFFNAAPIRNSAGELVAVIETLQDLTERKKGEDGAREMLSLLSATLEATADGILVVDGHGHVVTCNQNFSRLWRIPPQLLERQADDEPLLAYVASQMKEPEEFVARVNEIYGQPEVESHDIIHCSDGRVFERHSRPQRVDDVIVGRVWSFRDMSEQHRLEGQLRHAQKMEAIGTLSGGIAHDFNNILTAIIGYSGLLERKLRHDDQLRHYVQQIQTVSERACGLTQSLLAYSRKQITHLVPLDLNLCIGRVGRMLERLIGEDLELLLTLYPEELKITADSLQIEQVLMNLVTNARDAMPGGGVISIETELVNLDDRFIVSHGYGSGGKYAMLSISDTGSGMDEETVKRVFEPFFTTKEVGKGTGLGLSIVYGIIKKHNGFITCYSEVGKGSTFRIYIPSTDSSPLEERAVAPSLAEGIHGHEMILLAEDNSATRLLTRDILEEVGFKVLLAADGEEALSLFHQHQQEIDLVVLDVIMPKRKGKEVYDSIMESSASPPVLFISGYTADVIHRQGFLDTTLNFLAKPFTPSALLQKVREVLET